jgi:hypothetical protein
VLWHHSHTAQPPFARSVSALVQDLDARAQAHANVVILSDCGDLYLGGTPSYPLARDLRPLVTRAHELGLHYLWYQTAVTAGEYFYYYHPDWSTDPPYYHCGWLSMSPASRPWSQHLATDLNALVGRLGLDGVFLDNASATEWADAYTPAMDQAVGEHLRNAREGVKRADETAALVPNYDRAAPRTLHGVAGGWDANLTEGPHPCSIADRESGQMPLGRSLAEFGSWLQRMRRVAGRPIWPLMYAPDHYQPLSTAATAAVGCCPVFGGPSEATSQYYGFLERVEPYLYAPDVFPGAEGQVSYQPDDGDIAVVLRQKVYPSGQRDWIVHLLNARLDGTKPERREVNLALDLPGVSSGAFLLTPDLAEAQPVEVPAERPLRLAVDTGVWTMLVFSDVLAPSLSCDPPLPELTVGDQTAVQLQLRNPGLQPLKARIVPALPAGWACRPPESQVEVPAGATTRCAFTVEPGVVPEGESEMTAAVSVGERVFNLPFTLRARPGLELDLAPDHWALPSAQPLRPEIRVHNRLSLPVGGTVWLELPKGWPAARNRQSFQLAPGASGAFVVPLQPPKVDFAGYPDVRDYAFRIRANTNAGRGAAVRGEFSREVTFRLHQPFVHAIYCTLSTQLRDTIAAPGPSSTLITMVSAVQPEQYDKLDEALAAGFRHLDAGEPVVIWLRCRGETKVLDEERLARELGRFVDSGGGLLLQEDLFRSSQANRRLFKYDFCPIEEPFAASDRPTDWTIVDADDPALGSFVRLVLRGDRKLPVQQPAIVATVKPWASAVARNSAEGPAIVVSHDPKRAVAYIAGSLEGEYFDVAKRVGKRPTRQDWRYLCSLYADTLRWLALQRLSLSPSGKG